MLTEAAASPVAASRRIAVLCPEFFGYGERIEAGCRALGHHCLLLDERIGNGFLAKVLTRLGLIQRIERIRARHFARIAAAVARFDADCVIVLNPETMRATDVRAMRAAGSGARWVMYRWDSSSKKATPRDFAEAFDRCYSFDPVDCAAMPYLRHLPLFHCHSRFPADDGGAPPNGYAASFIGTARVRRIAVLRRLEKIVRSRGARSFFYLYAPSMVHQAFYRLVALLHGFGGTVSRRPIDYRTYEQVIAGSTFNVDVEQKNQNGLTIRTIEAVFTGRPLLTTNANVLLYDFARAYPVSVMNVDAPSLPERCEETRGSRPLFDKYGLRNWLSTLIEGGQQTYLVADDDPAG